MERFIYEAMGWAIIIAVSAAVTWILGVTGVFDYIEKLYL